MGKKRRAATKNRPKSRSSVKPTRLAAQKRGISSDRSIRLGLAHIMQRAAVVHPRRLRSAEDRSPRVESVPRNGTNPDKRRGMTRWRRWMRKMKRIGREWLARLRVRRTFEIFGKRRAIFIGLPVAAFPIGLFELPALRIMGIFML
jgi:hypothetical protein